MSLRKIINPDTTYKFVPEDNDANLLMWGSDIKKIIKEGDWIGKVVDKYLDEKQTDPNAHYLFEKRGPLSQGDIRALENNLNATVQLVKEA